MADAPPKTETQTDPFVAGILNSFEKVLEPDKVESQEPAAPTGMTLGEIVAQRAAKEETKTEGGTAAEPKTEEPKKEEVKTEEPKTTEPQAPRVLKFRKKAAPPETTPAAQTQQTQQQEPPPAAPEDAEFIKNLTEEQKEEYELALFAEQNGKPGTAKTTLEYFKKLDSWIAENPGADPESSDFRDFVEENKPKWSDVERRRMERKMITEQARAHARMELEPDVMETKRKLREIELKPIIESAMEDVEAAMTSKPPGDALPVEKDIIQRVRENYSQAAEEFPVEAPIVAGALNAAKSWLEISNGITRYDPNNRTHAWLVQFLSAEGANMAKQPDSVKIRDGKKFLPLHEYNSLPPEEAAKHWTYSDEEIVQQITDAALISITKKVKQLEKAGFKRERAKSSGQSGNQPVTATPAPAPDTGSESGSPRAGSRGVPGATDGGGGSSETIKFLEALYPGASKIAGAA